MLKQPSNGLSNGAGGSHDHANHVPRAWRKEASVYQVYPSSFKDSNGDGIGDIPGITSKVGYIQQLGVDIVWLCPIFKSPQADMGYDISDYCHVHEPHGTIENVEELIQGLHSPGMKCLLDLVVNHTSDQHNWFEQSRSSLSNSHRDWYIWRKPKYDSAGNRQPPNNWKAIFGGSAWEYDEQTDEYYLHLFLKEQPDLKWDHPPVRDAVCEVMRFWLDRGCDGFRIDAINFISKPPGLPDDRSENRWNMLGLEHYANGPRLHEYLKVIGGVLREYDAFSVGDMGHLTDLDEVLRSVGADRGELAMVFHFEIMDMDHGSGGRYTFRQT
ncbi:Glycosyl hydrolase, family 13, subfamily, catalytic domain [Lasallia pustulata]|uniref:Glycosyl hydrolase, family 13, subfamily, catalytic domain n=1 Tax=Lasallia pustulata TaxID=136370 RepID=A0A1W5D9I7_9LECA|nr:Glycosyl hydrolase, family 13, subfamily, catalytic domain [Lasallia pustulata]